MCGALLPKGTVSVSQVLQTKFLVSLVFWSAPPDKKTHDKMTPCLLGAKSAIGIRRGLLARLIGVVSW